jgi:hypothetical protein
MVQHVGFEFPLERASFSVRGETQIFRQFGFRQHFARFAQNASICANGEIHYISHLKGLYRASF